MSITSLCSIWPIRRFWQSTLQTPSYIWHFWDCSVLVSVIPLWSNSGRLCQWFFLRSCGLKLRCPPGVSTWSYSLCPLLSSYFWDYVLSASFTICPKMLPTNCCVGFCCCWCWFSRLDYCNSLLAGCSKYLLSKRQKVQNNAARPIFRTFRSVHVTRS